MSLLPSPVVLWPTTILAVLVWYVLRRRQYRDVASLPTPSTKHASWIWGHEYEVFEHESNEMYLKWITLLGPIFRIKAALFHDDVIITADHGALQHIFQQSDKYVKSPVFRPPIINLLGKGLVWAEGDDHKKQRKILAPAFSTESLKGMSDDIWECSEKLESRLVNRVLSADGESTVNIVQETSSCTLDIIGRVAFGHDFQSGQSTEAKEIGGAWTNHVNMGLSFGGFLAPLLVRSFPWIVKLPIPALQAQGTTKTIVTNLAMRIFKKGLVGESGKDILSLLMKADRDAAHDTDGLTPSQIVDNINTFTMVGHETTAGSVNFTLLQLARHPEVQRRLREEIQNVGHGLNYDSIQKLEYLDAVIREGLRLHPASPHTERVVLEDDLLPLSKPVRTSDGRTISSLRVKAGQVFHIPITAVQSNTAVWGEDGQDFKPERWVTPGGVPPPSELPHGWNGLITFADGPRMCIGYRLAILEFKVIIATLIRSLEFHDTSAIIKQVISPTLQPVTDGKGGFLPLRVTLAPSHR